MLKRIERVLVREQPDWTLVYGDTNSTLAGALAAAKMHIPVAHVEAGLRSFNKAMPEEINRVLTDHVSDLLFCPTQTAVDNLADEGITEGVHHVGDVMYDAALYYADIAEVRSTILGDLEIQSRSYLLVTVHRPRNTDEVDNLREILAALSQLDEPTVFPAHPRTREVIDRTKMTISENVQLIKPVGYLDMLQLERNARMILTDSGGIQKEAYFFGIPCLTLREETEWVETVSAGWNILVGADRAMIVEAIQKFTPSRTQQVIFGDGHSAEKIASLLRESESLPLHQVSPASNA
jgi:UDP-N-acetylglucosamine 2-epimerase